MTKKKIQTDDETISVRDAVDRRILMQLYPERGPQTDITLLAAGISRESQARNAPWVAEQVKLLEAA